MNYQLYADETGDFAKAAELVAVCALSVPEAEVSLLQAMREGAEAFAPEVPWPWHAAHLNQPVSWALWHAHRPVGQADWHPAASALAQLLAREAPALWQTCMDSLQHQRRPPMPELKQLGTRALSRAPDQLNLLCRRARAVREWLDQALRATVARPDVLGVVAFEDDGGSPTQDRYLQLLQVAFARSADALVASGPAPSTTETVLWLHVQNRLVRDPTLGVLTQLGQRHLEAAAVTAAGSPERRLVRQGRKVRLVPADAPAFDQHVDFLHVLTDRLANRSRTPLKTYSGDTRDLQTVCAQIWGSEGCPEGQLVFAPGGQAWEPLAAARNGGPVTPTPHPVRWRAQAVAHWHKELA